MVEAVVLAVLRWSWWSGDDVNGGSGLGGDGDGCDGREGVVVVTVVMMLWCSSVVTVV